MQIIELELVKIKERDTNPNYMNKSQISALKQSIERFGELQPVLIDQDFNLIDGHQRKKAYEELGKTKIPTIQLNLTKETDKLLLSQIMNHVKGQDNEVLEAEEFKKILATIELQEFTELTTISEQDVLNLINKLEKEPGVPVNEVEKLYTQKVKCPKCGFEFQKAQDG